jgi:hypothetical protein
MQKSLVNVQPTLVSQHQSFELVEPGERTLNHPPVPAQSLAALHSSPGDPRRDAPPSQRSSAPLEVVPFICVQLARPLSTTFTKHSPLLDWLDGVHYISEGIAVVNIGGSADYRERNSFGVDHNMALRRRFSFIRRIGAGTLAPFLAATVELSTAARDQSILPASPSLSSSTSWSFSQTPASCQSLRRLQQVEPLPQPISGGRYDQGKPVLSTNMMPVRAARLDTLGRPPFGFGRSGGKSDSITSHSSSLTNGLAMS